MLIEDIIISEGYSSSFKVSENIWLFGFDLWNTIREISANSLMTTVLSTALCFVAFQDYYASSDYMSASVKGALS